MINALEKEVETPRRQADRPRVVDERSPALNIERLTETMAMLEGYIDSLLAADGPPVTAPSIDDEAITLRMACL